MFRLHCGKTLSIVKSTYIIWMRTLAFTGLRSFGSIYSATKSTSFGSQLYCDPNIIEHISSLDVSAGINAWSVSGSSLSASDLASNLFAFSLFPYLAFLYFLGRPQTNTPSLGKFGFQFLLVFVILTIPAGIYAKYAYGDILANVDWLHGGAEAFLTITNLLIIYGFRTARSKPSPDKMKDILLDVATPILATIVLMSTLSSGIFPHMEPRNALSLPTWMIHSSSVLEWLIAMETIWDHSKVSLNPTWKGLTWGMLPSHTSGICACTFHFFYNNPQLYWIVALQAALTVFGNSCLAWSTFRIYDFEYKKQELVNAINTISTQQETQQDTQQENFLDITTLITPTPTTTPTTAVTVPQNIPLKESNLALAVKMFTISVIVAVIVKYGELFLDFPLEANSLAAVTMIVGFSIFPTANLLYLSKKETSTS